MRDGWRRGKDGEVMGVTRGMETEKERQTNGGNRGQSRSYELTKLIANKKTREKAIEEGN